MRQPFVKSEDVTEDVFILADKSQKPIDARCQNMQGATNDK